MLYEVITYTKYRTSENRQDREKVMKALFESYGDFKNMLGANLGGKVKKDWVYAKNRKYVITSYSIHYTKLYESREAPKV